jgi:ABC-type transport system involved in multi-copper enzyme maturation permease subunit
MSARILIRNETIKMTRFLPFRVTLLAFTALMGLAFVQSHLAAPRRPGGAPFALPDAWNTILSDDTLGISVFFLSVLLVLLTANEFTWRTARQNVIDGLSKQEWFLGKLLVVPVVASFFLLIIVAMGTVIASLGNDPARTAPLIRMADVKLIAAFILCQWGYGSIALLFSTMIRSPGSAIGVFFLYAVFVERLISVGLQNASERVAFTADYLPTRTFNALLNRLQWDPEALARATEVARVAGRPAPQIPDSAVLLTVASGWILFLLAIAFFSFRKRDL